MLAAAYEHDCGVGSGGLVAADLGAPTDRPTTYIVPSFLRSFVGSAAAGVATFEIRSGRGRGRRRRQRMRNEPSRRWEWDGRG